jgi:HAD superfamily hydrolase (TIGR01484 family)
LLTWTQINPNEVEANELMKPLEQLDTKSIRYVFTDIDDTITDSGQLPADSYAALWKLSQRGLRVIPITGRPAGWCEMIARFWPVAAVVGENGAFYFRYVDGKMKRHFAQDTETRKTHRRKLKALKQVILSEVPKSAISSDQFCRLSDLAIDFCEDIPRLSKDEIQKIVQLFEKAGATAKVSSIHVNGWFGDHDKLSMCKTVLQREFSEEFEKIQNDIVFSGDSPNDEPMFAAFKNSVAVANIQDFIEDLVHKPQFITPSKSAAGFVELTQKILGT